MGHLSDKCQITLVILLSLYLYCPDFREMSTFFLKFFFFSFLKPNETNSHLVFHSLANIPTDLFFWHQRARRLFVLLSHLIKSFFFQKVVEQWSHWQYTCPFGRYKYKLICVCVWNKSNKEGVINKFCFFFFFP